MSDQLKKLLGDELYNQVSEKLGDKKVLIQEKDGDFIPKARFDEVNQKKNELQKELDNQKNELQNKTTELEELKKKQNEGDKSVEDKIANLEKELEERKSSEEKLKNDLAAKEKTSILNNHLHKEKVNPKYLKDVQNRFNLDEIEVDENGQIKGFEEKIKGIKENYPEMFGEMKFGGDGPDGGNDKGLPDGILTKEDVKNMSEADRVKNVDKINESAKYWQ
jgi:chromosome segregation ATPase